MKKLKLLFSMASFCFALAVLCFGVFAATSVSYTIGGTITYDATGVYVDITGSIYRDISNSHVGASAISYANTVKSSAVAGTLGDLDTVAQATGTGYTMGDAYTYRSGVGYTEQQGTGTTGLNLKLGTYNSGDENADKKGYAYYIVLNVHNYGQTTVKATLALDTNGTNTTTNTSFSASTTETVASGADGKLVFAIAVTNVTLNASGNFAYKVTVEEYVSYSVSSSSVNVVSGTAPTLCYAQYSVDGTNWSRVTSTGINLTNCSSVWFRVYCAAGGQAARISSITLNLSLERYGTGQYSGTQTSNEIVLNQNVSDIVVFCGDNIG